MINSSSFEPNKSLSYSQILLKNLKRKKDSNEEQEQEKTKNFKSNTYNNKEMSTIEKIQNPSTNKSLSSQGENEKSKVVVEKKKVTPVLQQVTEKNVFELRKVYLSTFPLSYDSDFYYDVVNVYPKGLSRVATYHNIVVGGICCRLEKKTLRDIRQVIPETNTSFVQQINKLNELKLLNTYSCYIMAIAVLELYQNLSIGSRLMTYIIKHCEKDKSISSINLHVHVKNEKAIRFYKRYGFYQKDYIKNYYFNNPNIIPPDVYYFQKDLY